MFPYQVGIVGIQLLWTRDAEIALNNATSDKKIMPATDEHFLTILNTLIEVTTRDLTRIERTKYETLITIHLHQRDIFHDMVSPENASALFHKVIHNYTRLQCASSLQQTLSG